MSSLLNEIIAHIWNNYGVYGVAQKQAATKEGKMKKLNQAQIAQKVGISKSYLSMILSGQRKSTPELLGKLQAIPGVHKVVNNDLWEVLHTQEVTGSNPVPPTIKLGDHLPKLMRQS